MMFKFLLFIILLFPSISKAHPHVFIDAGVEIIFKEEKISQIKQVWQFDELFSSNLISDFDADNNRFFSKEEILEIKNYAFENLKNYSFFNNIFYDSKKIDNISYSDFNAKIKNDCVFYEFIINLENPINPIDAETAVGIYDPEFFVDIAYIKDTPVVFKNNKKNCSYEIIEDEKHRNLIWLVNPKVVYVSCQ